VVLAGAFGVVVVGEHGFAADPLAPHGSGGGALRRLGRRRHRRCPLRRLPLCSLWKSRKISARSRPCRTARPTEGIKRGAARQGRRPANGSEYEFNAIPIVRLESELILAEGGGVSMDTPVIHKIIDIHADKLLLIFKIAEGPLNKTFSLCVHLQLESMFVC